LAIGIKEGDEGITSPNTFVASANSIAYCGGRPSFADIDVRTFNIDPNELAKKITDKTRVVIPVHFAGQSAAMDEIQEIVRAAEKKYNSKIYIIEDASHALGSYYKGKPVGACAHSDMTVFSFHPVKHITSGEGGAITTNDETLYKRLKNFRSHGIAQDSGQWVNKSPGRWYMEQIDLGFNYRLTDIQATLGKSQLKKLSYFKERRQALVRNYNEAFAKKKNLYTPQELEPGSSNFHLYVARFDFAALKMSRDEFMGALLESGVGSQVHYIPVYTQPYYQKKYGYKWGDFPVAEKYYSQCLSLPLFPTLTEEEQQNVIHTVLRLTGNA
jgi:dTDP-4-amino-4,6-dideoxygalactose transaminase